MKKHILAGLIIGIFAAAFTLTGCSNPVEEMQANYYAGHYLEAAQIAVQGMKDSGLRPQIIAFMKADGSRLIEQGFFQAETLLKRQPMDNAVAYLKAYKTTLEDMALLQVPIPTLPESIKRADALLNKALSTYVKDYYTQGTTAFDAGHYRQAWEFFDKVAHYDPAYLSVQKELNRSFDKAARKVSLMPFLKANASYTRLITQSRYGRFRKTESDITTQRGDLRIEGVDILSQLSENTLRYINDNKSPFLTVAIADTDQPIPQSHYYVDSAIEAEVKSQTAIPVRERVQDYVRYSYKDSLNHIQWAAVPMDYERMKVEYRVTLSLKAGVYLTQNNEKVGSIIADKTVGVTRYYRGRPNFSRPTEAIDIEYPTAYNQLPDNEVIPNRIQIISEAIDQVAQKFAADLLNIVDIDHDPFSRISTN